MWDVAQIKSDIFVFLYFHQQAVNFCCLMSFLILLLCLCYFKFESQKYMNKVAKQQQC